MRLYACFLAALLVLSGCTTKKEYPTFITNTGPGDWQPPTVGWVTSPEAIVRGTVGIDVSAADSSRVDSVKLFVDGLADGNLAARPYRFTVITDSLEDGVHLLEARAWDQYGNCGVSPILRIHVRNQPLPGPRLIWVPDDYQTIQAAINAAADFDTIRVRDGVYCESLNMFGKAIWLESQSGPVHTTIDGCGSNNTVFVPSAHDPCAVRGFRMTGSNYVVGLLDGSRADLYNNVLMSDTASDLLITSYSAGRIVNNLFSGSGDAVELGFHWGLFSNNVIQNATRCGLWNAALLRNPIERSYNIFWHNALDYNDRFVPALGDFDADPQIDLLAGRLMPGSPAHDTGNPDILDPDGSRSDIGPYGGPWAYH
jgi:hypothetical protein